VAAQAAPAGPQAAPRSVKAQQDVANSLIGVVAKIGDLETLANILNKWQHSFSHNAGLSIYQNKDSFARYNTSAA
jgi:hypothetical protein